MNYIDNYKKLYQVNREYKRNLFPMYRSINNLINFKIKNLLDYGCGNSNMTIFFDQYYECNTFKYDPGIKQYENLNKSINYDLVINCDVMEHIPEEELDKIFSQISKLTDNVFFNIYLKEAQTILPDGSNAHVTIKPANWWSKKISKYFNYVQRVPTSYKNSASFITWKTTKLKLINAYLLVILDGLAFTIWKLKQLIKYKI